MKKLLVLLLISGKLFAQQLPSKIEFNDFKTIGKVEQQEKVYNEMIKSLPKKDLSPSQTAVYRAQLALVWLAKGNVERYEYYKSTNPAFDAVQFYYLAYALDKFFDEKKDYVAVAKISQELLDEISKGTQADELGQTALLMELNAAANAKLGNKEKAKAMIEASSKAKGFESLDIQYFKDRKSNYINRYAIVMFSLGNNKLAFEKLETAFEEAESNPYMVDTFREVYRKTKGSENGFQEYLDSLKEKAYRKYYKEVESLYVDSPRKTIEGTIPDPEDPSQMVTTFRATKPVQEITLTKFKE